MVDSTLVLLYSQLYMIHVANVHRFRRQSDSDHDRLADCQISSGTGISSPFAANIPVVRWLASRSKPHTISSDAFSVCVTVVSVEISKIFEKPRLRVRFFKQGYEVKIYI